MKEEDNEEDNQEDRLPLFTNVMEEDQQDTAVFPDADGQALEPDPSQRSILDSMIVIMPKFVAYKQLPKVLPSKPKARSAVRPFTGIAIDPKDCHIVVVQDPTAIAVASSCARLAGK